MNRFTNQIQILALPVPSEATRKATLGRREKARERERESLKSCLAAKERIQFEKQKNHTDDEIMMMIMKNLMANYPFCIQIEA